MQPIEPIARAIDFVEDHLQEAATVADMAEAAACSLYHFCRIFNQVTHYTPYDYLMRRRLSEAARALLQTDQKIIDIAFAYQFNSPETFSRAFKRMFGLQPNLLRKQGLRGPWPCLPRLTRPHLQYMTQAAGLTPRLEEKGACQVAGLMSLVQRDQPPIGELWARLAQLPEAASFTALKASRRLGLAYYPVDWEKRGFWYLAAFETSESVRLPFPWVTQTIPAAKYARFTHTGHLNDLALMHAYIGYTWLPQSGQTLAQPLIIESYPSDFTGQDSAGAEIEIYLPLQ
jgi:AraC family transcriptional regulator